MKPIAFLCGFCALALLVGMVPMPEEYYRILRFVVAVSAIVIVFREIEKKRRFWPILFLLTAILFNPIFPIFLAKTRWIWIDGAAAILFGIYGFGRKNK